MGWYALEQSLTEIPRGTDFLEAGLSIVLAIGLACWNEACQNVCNEKQSLGCDARSIKV